LILDKQALKRETDPASKSRLKKLQEEVSEEKSLLVRKTRFTSVVLLCLRVCVMMRQVAAKRKEEERLMEEWQREKEELNKAKEAQKELEAARRQAETAQRLGDWAKAGELVHAVIPVGRMVVLEVSMSKVVLTPSPVRVVP
jgi:ATP-dependent Clp protease ATP-binding subunit ClpB